MARTRREAREAPPRSAGREPTGPSAGGPLDVVVEEERLPDGRYVLYYTWTHPGAADDPGGVSVAPPAGDGGVVSIDRFSGANRTGPPR